MKDLGQVPTPVAYFAAARRGCGNVAIVTASHNAGRYNGVKFMVAGQPAVPELIGQLQALLDVPAVGDCPDFAGTAAKPWSSENGTVPFGPHEP